MAWWSAVGGQTQSPYIEGGVAEDATWFTNIGPAGSSSGSAVSVAAGFAPVSLGTELDGTIVMPAARAGAYAVELTPESFDNDGFQPGASCWDSQGPYAKTATDIATLSAILQLHDPGYYQPLTTSWNGLKVGFADPSLWRSYPTAIEPVEGFFNQTDNALFAAQAKIEESGGKVAQSVPVASWKDITGAMPDFSQMEDIFSFQMKRRFPKFLQLFEGVPQTLEEAIKFNNNHADLEGDNNQKGLEAGRDTNITQEEYDRNFKALRAAASHTLLSVMKGYDVDVLLVPCDSRFASVGAAAGFPVGNLPLGFADFNGRPFSLHAIAPANEEVKIFQVMSAWEASFPDNVCPPPLLVDDTFPVQKIVMEDAD
ncbi:hypothetical protein FSOLCH5_011590 [Fusarium solani]